MSEFEQMLNESFKTIKTGEVVKGTVLAVKENEIVVNIGYKHDGLIKREDFTADAEADLAELVKVGDEIEARVIKTNDGDGNVILTTRKARVTKVSQVLTDACENKTVLTAVVDEVVNGGLKLTVDEVSVFMPASLVSTRFESDLSGYVGQEIRFRISEYNPKKHRVIANRKDLLKEEREAAKQAVLETITEGSIVEGTVSSITAFGAFIDLGGVDGLLHISEMSWNHISNPKKLFNVGDTVRVYVKAIDEKKIALSAKFPEDNPWKDAEEIYAVGNTVTGKVARLKDFGAFIELAKGVDGLLHVSQITNERIEKPEDVLTLGQEVTAQVVGLDLENKKISLSVKALLPKPERKERPRREAKKEENYTNEDGFVNVDAYIKKIDEEEAKKAAKEAAEAAEAAAETVVEEATEAPAQEATETTEA